MDDNIVATVQKLLAKAENEAVGPEEAEAFFAKAQELMIRHAIDEQQLREAKGGTREKPVITEFVYSTNDANLPAKIQMLAGIRRANSCQAVFHAKTKREQTVTLIGYESDVEFVKLLYVSAVMQCLKDSRRGMKLSKAELTGFMLGFANAVAKRLADANKAVEAEVTGASLVLYDRAHEVSITMKEAFPRTTKLVSRANNMSRFGDGLTAGNNADLSGGRNRVSAQKSLGE